MANADGPRPSNEVDPIEPGSGTGSRTTLILGAASLAALGLLIVLAFGLTEPDAVQGDSVRMLYVHVPSAIAGYAGFVVAAGASVMVLWKRSQWWDTVAVSGAEIGLLFTGLMLATGIIWGRPIWNTWWEWGDVRLMTSLMLFLVYTGYLAYRRVVPDAGVRARRSAVIALVGVVNIPIVRQSVEWWASRTLHQQSTLAEGKMEDLTLFSLMFAFVVFAMIFAWMLIHRFRLGWLEHQAEAVGLQAAIAERQAQADADIDDAITPPDPDTPLDPDEDSP